MKITLGIRSGTVGALTEYEAEVGEVDAEEAKINFYSMFRPPMTEAKSKWINKLTEQGYGRLALKQKPQEGKPDGGALVFDRKVILYTKRKGADSGSL